MDWWIQTDTGLGTPQSGTKAGSYEATSRWAGHPARPHIEDQPTSAAPKKGANPAGHSQDGIETKKTVADFKIALSLKMAAASRGGCRTGPRARRLRGGRIRVLQVEVVR